MGLKSRNFTSVAPQNEKQPIPSFTNEDSMELDIIQRLRNNLETLKKSQERVEFLNKELSSVLNLKNK